MSPGRGSDEGVLTKGAKVQWKRRARMKGSEMQVRVSKEAIGLEKMKRKRESKSQREELECRLELQPEKKWKGSTDRGVSTISEVEKTNREWSQAYK